MNFVFYNLNSFYTIDYLNRFRTSKEKTIIKSEIENKISLNQDKKQKLLHSLNNFKSVNSENNYMPWQLRFFDVFLEKNGFDIIIANPPYNREKGFAEMFEPVNKSLFGEKYHSGKMNFWYYFLHKAIDKSNDNAIISFITSRYWITSTGSKSLIKRIKDSKKRDLLEF